MCGVVGIISTTGKQVVTSIYDALTIIQHRGQDAAGIATIDKGKLHLHCGNGLVRNVFKTKTVLKLTGTMGLGHVRYPTAGSAASDEAQPFYVNSPYGIAMAHNGTLTNADVLKKELFETDLRHINTSSDSEVLLNVFANEMSLSKKYRIDEQDVFEAISRVHKRIKGAYSVVSMLTGFGIIGFRDPHGIRPLIVGKRTTNGGEKFMIASESVALTALGYEIVRDVAPGEGVIITKEGKVSFQQCCENVQHSPCIFEFVYFARPDSIIDNVSVYKSRLRMGETLAKKIKTVLKDEQIDVVIPIPDTSRTAALQLASELDIKFREGFVKNRYIARTFIMPEQKQRKKSVRQKLSAIELEFKGKNVLLVDDSIVRGTTSKEIVKMARDVGAKKVFFASAAPPVRYPNVYGIDMASKKELVAHNNTVDEICQIIGADRLVYQDLDDLIWAVQKGNENIKSFDASCFNGEYITGDIDADFLANLEKNRNK